MVVQHVAIVSDRDLHKVSSRSRVTFYLEAQVGHHDGSRANGDGDGEEEQEPLVCLCERPVRVGKDCPLWLCGRTQTGPGCDEWCEKA